MRTCEVAIIGLGLMGSSALHSLVRRGIDVLMQSMRVGVVERGFIRGTIG